MERAVLPNFLVIGAMKSGTTSLFRYLGDHPDVEVSPYKETDFFADDVKWSRGLDWYADFFRGLPDACAVGECSTAYSKYPEYPDAARRIVETLPDVRLIYVLRDPIVRLLSHYQHTVLTGTERRPLEDAVREVPSYLDTSRYAMQLGQYLGKVSDERILLLDSHDLRVDRRRTMERVFGFLGVDAHWWSDAFDIEHYVTTERRGLRSGVRRILDVSVVHRASRLVPQEMRRRAGRSRALSREERSTPGQRDAVDANLHAWLTAELADDVNELRELAATRFGAPLLGEGWLTR